MLYYFNITYSTCSFTDDGNSTSYYGNPSGTTPNRLINNLCGSAPRVSLAPKIPFPFPFERLRRRLPINRPYSSTGEGICEYSSDATSSISFSFLFFYSGHRGGKCLSWLQCFIFSLQILNSSFHPLSCIFGVFLCFKAIIRLLLLQKTCKIFRHFL